MNFVLYKLLHKHLPSILFGFLLISATNSTSALAHNSFSLNTSTMQVAQQARPPAKQQLKVQSSQQAAQMAKARLGGKVLKVQKQNTGYRVKLIKDNGYIVSVFVDARSGRVSGGK
ncbi:PepSY domain-containing protein [Colwellia sp. E150_009]|jgi:uncharacterized membrane protein YkoI